MRRHQALCLLKLGYAYQAMGDYRQAIADMEESLSIFRELRLTHYEERVLQTIETCRQQLRPSELGTVSGHSRLDRTLGSA